MPDLYVLDNATQQPGSVPLNFYFNSATNHHMTTASEQGNAWALANGYKFVRIEGWVYGTADPSYLPLEMWYGADRGELVGVAQESPPSPSFSRQCCSLPPLCSHFLVGTADNR